MADVIREVLIRGKMEIVKADLQVPDISSFNKATQESNRLNAELLERVEAVAKAQEEAAQLGKQREEDERRRRTEEAAARAERKKAADELKAQEEAEKKAAEEKKKADAEAAAAAAEELKAIQEATKAEEERRRVTEEYSRERSANVQSQRELNDLYLKGAEGLKQTTDGAFAFARGLTLVSLEGSDDLEQIVRKIAEVQGKFDLLRGGVDFLKGTAESARSFGDALEKAGGASAVLTRGLTSAGAAVAPLVGALGPAGAIALGVGAIAVASAAAWKAYSDNAQDAADKAIESLRKANDEAGKIARERNLSQLDAKLGASVATAQDRLAVARATGSEADQEAARQALANERIRAAQERDRKLREQAADPRLSAVDRSRLTEGIVEAGGLTAEAERAKLLEDTDVRGSALQKQRDEAEKLLKEQRKLQEERRELQDFLDNSQFGSSDQLDADIFAATDRVSEIDDRIKAIADKNPAATLANAVKSLVELQESTNEQVETLNRAIATAKSSLEQQKAFTARLEASLREAQN